MAEKNTPNLVLTLVCHNRPEYLAQVLASIKHNVWQESGSVRPSIVIVRDDATPEVNRLIDEIDWIQRTVYDTNLGINYANRHAYLRAIRNHSADYVLAIEDDTVLAPDCFALVRWFMEQGGAVLNCFSRSKTFDQPQAVRFGLNFCPWVWAFNSVFYRDVLDSIWMKEKDGWDWSIKAALRTLGVFALEPVLSRSRNIGQFDGVHYTPQMWEEEHGPLVMSDGSVRDYKLIGDFAPLT